MDEYVIRTEHAAGEFWLCFHHSGAKSATADRDQAARMSAPVAYLMKLELDRQDVGTTDFTRHIEKL